MTTQSRAGAVGYDPFSAEFQADPFPIYQWMRDQAPVYRSEKWGWYALSRFDDVRAAALDPDTFRSFEGIDIDDTAVDQSGPGFLPDLDNPRHDQVRSVVQPQLLPRRMALLEDSIRDVVRGLVETWRTRGSVDLAQELSWPLPFQVFFNLLGLPTEAAEGRDQLVRWMHEMKDREPDDPRLTPLAKAATANIKQYFIDLLHDRRLRPRSDLVTHLVGASIDGVAFAEDDITAESEISGLMMVLFLGGVETTAGLTSTIFKLLAENPDQRALLRRDPSLVPAAVDEAVRFATPLQLVGRTAVREVHLHGTTIPAGARVVLVYGAANRDERQFVDPDRFDITRARSRHLGFGEGVHGCLGAPLARLEVQVAVEEALPVLGEYVLAGPAVRPRTTPNLYVWEHLPLSFTPAPAPAPTTPGGPDARVTTAAATDPVPLSPRRASTESVIDAMVESKQRVAEGIVALSLRRTDGGQLPAWLPGAHVDLDMPGAGTRQYSLCGDPTDVERWQVAVLREPASRGGSRFVHDTLKPGDNVTVRGPRNHFALLPSPRYLFLAGGIGITPLLAMIAHAQASGAEWELIYGGRTRPSMAFVDHLSRYGEKVRLWPQDECGLLPLDELLGTPRPQTLIYCCGPEPLLAAVEQRCNRWPAGALHVERFSARAVEAPVRAEAFHVELARSHVTLEVLPGRSILSTVEDAGVAVVSSCAEGTCGTCETRVLAGLPEHRDSVLSDEERRADDCMMICVSRARSERLVLDL